MMIVLGDISTMPYVSNTVVWSYHAKRHCKEYSWSSAYLKQLIMILLTLLNTSSNGIKSGEYGGRKSSFA